MNFKISENQILIEETISEFCKREIRPNMMRWDESQSFPTELFNSIGEKIREIGNEYGATTGRDRRCGWLDLVALKYTVQINGVTELNIMKSDVLSSIDKLKVCTSYIVDNKQVNNFPFDIIITNSKILKN